MDSDLEALSRNPTDNSFVVLYVSAYVSGYVSRGLLTKGTLWGCVSEYVSRYVSGYVSEGSNVLLLHEFLTPKLWKDPYSSFHFLFNITQHNRNIP